MKNKISSLQIINLCCFILAIFSIASCRSSPSDGNGTAFADNVVIAHRGAWKENGLPENSIASLKHAIKLGCTGSEFDVRMTSDNILIVTHDADYNNLLIEESTYAELSKFKLSNGETLPTLREYLLAGITDNPSTGLVLEIKPSKKAGRNKLITEKVLSLIKEVNAEPFILVYISFSFDVLKQIEATNPSAKTLYLDGSMAPNKLKENDIDGLDYLAYKFKRNPTWIEDSKKLGLILNTWTIDNPADIDWFLAKGFDFITTNEPELVFERMKQHQSKDDWKLVWSDEFEYSGRIDSTKWAYEYGLKRNQEAQYYSDGLENVRVEDGMLILEAHKSKVKNESFVSKGEKGWKKNTEYANYTSGSVTTKNKGEWTYGRIEIKAKLPSGTGVWPALWMIGENYDEVGWPECGEIDIMEYVGFQPDSIFGTIHTKAYNHMRGTQKGKNIKINKPSETFHLFVLEWTPETMDFILNDTVYNHIINEHKTTDEWPFDQDFHLKMNLAIGGMLGGRKGIDDSIFPQQFVIDYVRVYQKEN